MILLVKLFPYSEAMGAVNLNRTVSKKQGFLIKMKADRSNVSITITPY